MKTMLVAGAFGLLLGVQAMAADYPVKAAKAPPPPPPPAFDVAIGAVVWSDYNFRGVSQTNRGPSGGAYFEAQFNTSVGTWYAGLAGWGVDWPSLWGFTNPSAEIDLYGGWRNTWGAFSLDLGYIYYWYPKEIFNGFTSDSDFWEIYAKAAYAFTPDFTLGANVFYTPDLLHYSQTFFVISGTATNASAVYASLTAKWVLPWKSGDWGSYLSGELGHWWIDDTGFISAAAIAAGLPGVDPSYTYGNIGLALTYKALTIDFRFHGNSMSVAQCASFLVTVVGNPSNRWCGDTFIVALKFDTSLSALK